MANNSNGILIVALAAAYLWWTSREPAAPASNGNGGNGSTPANETGSSGYVIDAAGNKRRWSTADAEYFGTSIDPGTAAQTIIDKYMPVAQW